MAKQPKLVLRQSCVMDMSQDWSPSSFIEMGAGPGGMTQWLLDRGFHGACHDLGTDSRAMARANLVGYGNAISVVENLKEVDDEAFDYMFAFEVLEHIEDDLGVLREWTRHLKPGGKILVSVPAHQRKFGRSDELVGHVRRYEKEELTALLQCAGFEKICVVSYGFPITELTRRFSNFLVRNDSSYDQLSAEERSVRSAQTKPMAIKRWLGWFSGNLVAPFRVTQRCFYPTDLGDGYVATAIKRQPPPVE